jgi:hypothetical protein
MTAPPDEVATIVLVGICNPNSARQFEHRRDSNGAKLQHTGQANARTNLSCQEGPPDELELQPGGPGRADTQRGRSGEVSRVVEVVRPSQNMRSDLRVRWSCRESSPL